jgi:hypothetical protein
MLHVHASGLKLFFDSNVSERKRRQGTGGQGRDRDEPAGIGMADPGTPGPWQSKWPTNLHV